MDWNFGDIFDAAGRATPGDNPALIHGERTVSWAELTRRSNNLAAQLLARGAQPDDKVAFYMRNRPEYMKGLIAAFKVRLVHVNYRYLDDELHYILDNSDAKFVFFSSEFGDRITKLRDRLPGVTTFIQVGRRGAARGELRHARRDGTGEPIGMKRSAVDIGDRRDRCHAHTAELRRG